MAIYMRATSGEVFTTENPEYHNDCERLTKAAGIIARRNYCRAQLRAMLKPGQTVYTVLRSVSSSGMSRVISVCVADAYGDIRNIDTLTADATGHTLAAREGIKVTGCGMDMGFSLVYALGSAIWPDGTPEPHGTRNGAPDTCGGYALKHQWL